jgi:hypothetical protein
MQRAIRSTCLCLTLLLFGVVSPAYAQYVSVNAVRTSPNPFSDGQAVELAFRVDYDYGGNYATNVYVEIWGSDGYDTTAWNDVYYSQSSVEFSVYDGLAGGYYGDVFYTIQASVLYYDPEWGQTWWAGPTMGSGQATYAPRPRISGPGTLWSFGGQTPSGYATSVTLTSDAGPSTQWSVIQGSNKVTLSSQSGSSVTVNPTASMSNGHGDILITATANGLTSEAFALTSRTPHRLEHVLTDWGCDGTYGYRARVLYVIKDQLGDDLPANVPVNEDWTTGVVNDYPNTNWRQANPLGFTTENGAAFEDGMFGEYPGLPAVPQPTCDGNSQPVQHWGQAWRIGSEAIGAGTLVQTNTLQKLIGRAIHTNIVSPPQ